MLPRGRPTTRRCATYARYSSDVQRDATIEDQIRKSNEFAAAKGSNVLQDYVVSDQAVSGDALSGRVAVQWLIARAKRKPRPLDCILIEDTSRLARNLSDARRIIEILAYCGVAVVSVSVSEIGDCSAERAIIAHNASQGGRTVWKTLVVGSYWYASPDQRPRAVDEWRRDPDAV
jgi:DNA invertase Pin-like site-specific DNA recombinase